MVGRRAGGARNHSKGNRRPDDWQRIETGDSAKVQIGAELLCKCVTHAVRERDRGRDRGRGRKILSGLGSRQSGAGFRCSGSGTGSGSEFFPHPYLYLITRTWDLRAETWDPKMSLVFVSLQLGQHAVLTLPVTTAGAWSRLPKAERLTPERPMPRWPSPVT